MRGRVYTVFDDPLKTDSEIMPKLSLATVQKRIAALQKTAEILKKKDKQPAIKAILAMMAKHDVSIGELRAALEGGAARKTRAKTPVAAKFRDPQTGKTWSGRGRTPVWLSEAEAAGKQRHDFLIK